MKKYRIFSKCLSCLCAAAFLLMCTVSCSPKARYVSDTFFAMDTVIEVKLAADTPDSSAIFGKCRNITAEYEKMLSAEDGDSDIARFNMSESGCKVSLATGELFLLAQELYRLTDGRFDPTTYPSTLLWRSAGQLGELPESNEIEVAAQKRGMELISYDPSDRMLRKLEPWVMLDFGGIGKGYAESELIEYLKTTDAEYGVLSFGGNISVFGTRPGGSFSIALRDPAGASAAATIELTSGFVSVSGGYERYYEIAGERYCHIIDPASGVPVSGNLLSSAVISENGAAADALSTSLFVGGNTASAWELYSSQKGGAFEFEAILIFEDEIYITPGLRGCFEASSGRTLKILDDQ